MPPEQPKSDFKYWAFISYSHTDEKWADWLHKALETYRVPPHLVGRETKHGEVPKRLFPVFRDRDELPGSANLGEHLESALRESRYLIVICSPRAAASKWVNQEVRIFKSLGREDRVLCLVVEGEPNATTRTDVHEPECLPEAVRFWVDEERHITQVPTEPIAADARKGKDGKKNGLLKILAGVLGLEFDSLRQREEERRLRQHQVTLVVTLVLTVAFFFIGQKFYQQRNEALEAKAEALQAKERIEEQILVAKTALAMAEESRKEAVDALQEAERQRRSAQEEAERALRAEREAAAAATAERTAKDAASAALIKAKADRELAEAAKIQAEQNEKQMRRTLAVSDFTAAAKLIEEGNEPKALAYLSRALRYDSKNAAVVSRVISLLSQKSWALPRVPPMKHSHEVKAAAYSPDGNNVATMAGKSVHVWNAATGRELFAPLEHTELVTSIEFSPNGKQIVTTSRDHTAQLWDTTTGKKIGAPLQHSDWVLHATFSPEGNRVATASQDKTVKIWETRTGRMMARPLAHPSPVRLVRFSPDGGSIATAFVNSARRWDLATGQMIGATMAHEGSVYAVSYSPDGRFIATGGPNSARVWDAVTGEAITAELPHGSWVVTVQFSPDSRLLVSASSDSTARLWNITTGKEAIPHPLKHDQAVNAASFSPNGRWVVTASTDGTARIWDATTGRQVVQTMNHATSYRVSVHDAKFSPDGKFLITASADTTAKIWQVSSGKPAVEPLTHEQQVNSACFSPDGQLLATVSNDRTARIWNVHTGEAATEPLRHKGPIVSAAFSPDGKLLATGSEDGAAQVWEVRTGRKVFAEALQHGSWVNSVSFSPDGKWLVTGSEDRRARVWNLADGSLVYEPIRHDGVVKSAVFSPDGKWIISASYDKNIRVWNASTRVSVSPTMTHDGDVRAAALSPDGKWVVTGAEDNKARIWNPDTGKLIIDPLAHDSAVSVVAFSPAKVWNERKWVVTVADKTARVWEATTGKAVTEPLKHDEPIRAASFGPNGELLVTASGNTVRIWETSSGRLVSEPLVHDGPVRSVMFSPDGNFIVTTSADQAARIWLVTIHGTAPAWLGELADAVGGYKLDDIGAAELFSDNWKKFVSIRNDLANGALNDNYTTWGRWFMKDRSSRTISAFSKTTVADYVERRVSDGTMESLNEALELQPDSGLALARLARLSADPVQADVLAALAEHYEPKNPDVLWIRAQVLQKINKSTDGLAAMERAIALDPRNVKNFGPEGVEFSFANREGAVSKGWLPLGWHDSNALLPFNIFYTRIDDVPMPDMTGLEMNIVSAANGQAELRGPRFVCRRASRMVVEGWVRSATRGELNVVLAQFLEPYQKYKEQVVRATPDWKPFKIQFSPTTDVAAELRLLQSAGHVVHLAGISVRPE
jgi:WD40 repeat protein